MTSVGVFREKEINGKPFHIFTTFLSQTDNSSPSVAASSSSGEEAVDSGGYDDDSLYQPRFLCPSVRFLAEKLKQMEDGYSSDGVDMVPVITSPRFSNVKVVDEQQVRNMLDPDNHDVIICKEPVLPLFWCNNRKTNAFDSRISCDACEKPLEISSGYYLCVADDLIFHKECVESPLEIKAHPSYPFVSLRLYTVRGRSCCFCETQIYDMAYCCPTSNLSMHPVCALKPIPIVIDHFKRHPHPLTFFPKQASLACNVCGMVKQFIPTYVCARCVFVVHQDCIYFPYVIRISRHQHRISFTSSVPSGEFSCGVCRQKVENGYGAYSCNHCDGYFVHSRCALRRDLWDGEELEGVPEEPEIIVKPFETIDDGMILHFSHGHHLKLEISRVYDEKVCCQGCILPIYEGNYYSCVHDHCDYILHETCANVPFKIHHPLHAHSLALKVVTNDYDNNHGYFRCVACLRYSCGFVYEDSAGFRLDLRCALVYEPFHYKNHEHPLFLALSPEEEESALCQICHGCRGSRFLRCRMLNCIECNYIICFRCATLPYKTRYKHDKHFLTFRKEAKVAASDQLGWCEACEGKIVYSEEAGVYECDEYCCTTLHVDCLLGKDPYMMKHGQTITLRYTKRGQTSGQIITQEEKFHILGNNTMSRPICHSPYCGRKRCSSRVFYQRDNLTTNCSWICLV